MYKVAIFITIVIVLTSVVFMGSTSLFKDRYVYSVKNPTNIERVPFSKSPKVLVFNSFSYKDNILPPYADFSIKINRLYCSKYGYDYRLINHAIDELPPYWLRVKDAYSLLNETDYDVIMYLDLDAVFHDFSNSLSQLLENKYDFFVSKDPANLFSEDINTIVNSGCFIVKNCSWSKNFLRQWLYACIDDKGDMTGVCKSDWKFNLHKWVCKGCKWAGIKYEQGMLGNLYISNIENAQEHVCIL